MHPNWAWPELERALECMRQFKRQGTTVLVLTAWSPAWLESAAGYAVVGPPQHHDPLVRSLCWTVLLEDAPDSWATLASTRAARSALVWRHSAAGNPEQSLF
jgi:hypothetical protein